MPVARGGGDRRRGGVWGAVRGSGRWLWWSGGATGGECAGKRLRGADERQLPCGQRAAGCG